MLMKILMLVQNYFPSVGGTQIFFQNLAERAFTYYGYEVTVFTTNSYLGPDKSVFRKIEPQNEILNNVKIHRFSFYRWHRGIFKFLGRAFIRLFNWRPEYISAHLSGPWSPGMIKRISETDADVIVGSSHSYLYMKYPLWRNNIENPKPFIFQGAIHFNNNEQSNNLSCSLIRAIQKSEYYLANTVYEKARLVSMGIEEDKIEILGSAVDIEKFGRIKCESSRPALAVPDDSILIAYIGRIESTKGIDILIRAMQEVWKANSNIHLIIAGYANEYIYELEKLIADYLPEERNKIRFIKDIPEEEKVQLYQSLDVLVLPSVNESFGMVFLEAWACKKPVIGMNIGAVRSVISNGVDGLLAEAGNKNDLAIQILKLAGDKNLRSKMGERGYEKVINNYTWDIIMKKFNGICEKAILEFKNKRKLSE